MTEHEPCLTVVMYHYVRPIAGSAHPGIKGLELERFRGQLAWLGAHHTFVTVNAIIDAARGGAPLPDRSVLLTFDDGYADHVTHVFPLLREASIQGAFYPPSEAVLERKALDVNKVHFVLASGVDPAALVRHVDEVVLAHQDRDDVRPLETYRDAHLTANRFDPAEVIYVKRMLQHALPPDLRHSVVEELFAAHVSGDERGFADELYVSVDDLVRMVDGGMHVGTHGHAHHWLDQLSPAEQAVDIDRSLDLLDAMGLPRREFTFCYPYGGYDATTVALLEERGCDAAFTTIVGVAPLPLGNLLEVPRIDTNDLPTE